MICSNFGRRSDKIVRSKEKLARIWLFQRYRVKLFKARKSRDKSKVPCHAYRKHGPQNPLSRIKDRILQQTGEARAYGMNRSRESSKFNSMGLLWYAREMFLIDNEHEMRRRAQGLNCGTIANPFFEGEIVLSKPIGEGFFMDQSGTAVEVHDVRRALFRFIYDKGVWYEVTAFPVVRHPM